MTVPAPDRTLSRNGVQPAAAQDPDDHLFEPGWNRPKRTNKLTFVLLAALVAALAFAGGVAVQKQHDARLATTAGRTRGVGGFGGAAGFAGTGGAGGTTGQGGASGQGAGGSPASTGGMPVAIGTVKSISGTTLTITNFAGTTVTVTVPSTATVTTPGLRGLTVGATVSVAGTTNADGTVTATSVTSRRTG
jgi:hypothetical protein